MTKETNKNSKKGLTIAIAVISPLLTAGITVLSFSNELHEFLERWFDKRVVINTPHISPSWEGLGVGKSNSIPPVTRTQEEEVTPTSSESEILVEEIAPKNNSEEQEKILTSTSSESKVLVEEIAPENNKQEGEKLVTPVKFESKSSSEQVAEEKADIYISPYGFDILRPSETTIAEKVETENKADIYVSSNGTDIQTISNQSLNEENVNTLLVGAKGNNSNAGAKESPYRSLTYAIEQAQKIQAGDVQKTVVIQMESGTYSTNSGEIGEISIPAGITIKGRGENTIILASVNMTSNASLENLQIKNNPLTINSQNAEDVSVSVKGITIYSGGITINQSSPNLSDIKIVESNQTLNISGGNPTIKNLQVANNYTNNQGIVEIQPGSSPILENVIIENNNLGISNAGNLSIQNLEIVGNNLGIINNGEMTITNLKASGNKYGAICNQGTMFIQGSSFDNTPPKTLENCPSLNQEPPITVPDIAGNIEGVIIN